MSFFSILAKVDPDQTCEFVAFEHVSQERYPPIWSDWSDYGAYFGVIWQSGNSRCPFS